ncbi:MULTISPECIES: hypothetical protein [unclassified Lentimonas]|uniref:hypothetical protein n=1 Tax=unclassified Lentimonas TaxID=2630993 RepID=UPI00138A4FA8|nr:MULTISPECIES: hypothetical protein [unclassified Lentimonas]
MKKIRNVISLCSVLLSVTVNAAPAPVTVSVTTSQPGHVISPTSIGVSYEIELLEPENGELPYFRPDNKPLVAMFKTLGIKNLRLGGNTLDYTKKTGANEEQIASVFEFAKAAGAEVIYSVRLKDTNQKGEPEAPNFNIDYAAKAARFIRAEYPDVLDSFAIGNEPYYYKDWDIYSAKWKAIRDAIVAEYPEAVFSGPDHNPNEELDNNMVREFSNGTGPLVKIARHFYPFGCAYENPRRAKGEELIPKNEVESRELMLSSSLHTKYGNVYKRITQAQALSDADVSYRLTESNSFSMSGLKDVSDSYASALWGLDYLCWWAAHESEGIDFHTGDKTSGAGMCKYAVFVTSGNGYEARPLAYGMKMFDIGGHGKMLPIENSAKDLAVYATLNDDLVAVTLINKEHGDEAEEQLVKIKLDTAVDAATAEIIFLRGRNNDIAGGSADVTLGGVQINEDGTWDGEWSPLSEFGVIQGDELEVKMPPASAAVVRVAIR